MECLKSDELLDFSLKLLSPEKEFAFLEHLSQCSFCSTQLQAVTLFQEAFEGYIEATEQQASPLLKQQTFAQLKQEFLLQPQGYPWRRHPLFYYALTAAALLFLLALAGKSLFFQKAENPSIEHIQTTEGVVPLDEKTHLVLAKAFDSELHQMLASLEEMSIETTDESEQLADEYLNEVIFATFEDE